MRIQGEKIHKTNVYPMFFLDQKTTQKNTVLHRLSVEKRRGKKTMSVLELICGEYVQRV